MLNFLKDSNVSFCKENETGTFRKIIHAYC